MDKYLLLSVLVANVVIPAAFANDPLPRRGMRRTILAILLFNCLYILGLLFLYPRLIQ